MEYVIVIIIVSVIIFLLLREFFCWYFKINKRISLFEEILFELKKMNENGVEVKDNQWIEERTKTLVQEGTEINKAKIQAISEYQNKNTQKASKKRSLFGGINDDLYNN